MRIGTLATTVALCTAMAAAVAQPHYVDRRDWAPTGGHEDPAGVAAARSACHDVVTLGLLEEENYDSPLFRMTPSEKRLHALRWAREAFAACMRERGFVLVDGLNRTTG